MNDQNVYTQYKLWATKTYTFTRRSSFSGLHYEQEHTSVIMF